MAEVAGKVAWVVGGSGLTGSLLLRSLLATPVYARVLAISRRPLPFEHPRLANRILRFEQLETELRGQRCDDAFCCLGTTRRAAGSSAGYHEVDHDLTLRFARCAQQAGARQLLVVSSISADARSRNPYLRTKGETETALERLQFPALHIMQPGLLLGARREIRYGEQAAALLFAIINPLLLGRWQDWRAIAAADVAAAMCAAALQGRLGVHRHRYGSMRRLLPSRSTGRM
jgi:uncharacterized protein YbjT (DUF2867 family)